jgi:2-polyprenyl-3-methyl-5-hydroxy-6-metoxy-1,4-benzoquinol methylase
MLCGSPIISKSLHTDAGEYIRCRECGTEKQIVLDSQINNRFAEAENEFYGESAIYFASFFSYIGYTQAKKRLEIVLRYLKQGSLIEVGPGSGHFLSLASGKGFVCEAVEFSAVLGKYIQDRVGLPVYQGVFESLPLKINHYDAVVSFHVIEHSENPIEHLRKALEVVKLGGYVFLATPNANSWQHRIMKSWSPNYCRAHLYFFSKKGLKRVIKSIGGEAIDIVTIEDVFDTTRAWTTLGKKLLGHNAKELTNSGGSIVKATPFKAGVLILSLIRIATWPIRKIQEAFYGGNQLFVIARKQKR